MIRITADRRHPMIAVVPWFEDPMWCPRHMDRPAAWDAYEEAVMAGQADDVEAPGDDYVMSPEFQQWLVDQLRKEVMDQALAAVMDVQPKIRDNA